MPASDPARPSRHRLGWPAVIVIAILAGLIAYLVTLWRAHEIARVTATAVRDTAGAIAERFRSGTITTTFLAYLPEVSSDGSGLLELARADVTETLTRSDERRVLFDLLSLGTTVVEIRVPVTYRYHLRLDEAWQLDIERDTVVVQAPAIRPTLPPALHTQRLERRSASGWLRFDTAAQLDELQRTITPTLVLWAKDQRHLALVREECRKTVARFVQGWLLTEGQWRPDGLRHIVVRFSDEDDPDLPLPTLSFRHRSDVAPTSSPAGG